MSWDVPNHIDLDDLMEDLISSFKAEEYPKQDGYGTLWYDASGFQGEFSNQCFICMKETLRVDINLDGPFCNSDECNETIRRELEEME